MDQQLHSQFESNATPPGQADRSETLPASGARVRPVNAGTVAPSRGRGTPKRGRVEALRARIMDALADGRPWLARHVIERAGEGVPPTLVWQQLRALAAEELIVRPRHGIWLAAEVPATLTYDKAALRLECLLGRAERRLLDRLTRPKTAPGLVNELALSRQRIYQILHQLLQRGEVKRIRAPAFARSWIWMRQDDSIDPALLPRRPFADTAVDILSCLEPDAFHSARDIARAVRRKVKTVYTHIYQLEALGLVTIITLGERYASITPRGLNHPARCIGGPQAEKADPAKPLQQPRLAFLEKLAVLGEARTIDVTAALAGADQPGTMFLSGQMAARLVQQGRAEIIERKPGGRRMYRLTEAGRSEAALMARLGPPPTRQQLEERIAAYRSQRTARLRASGLKNSGRVSGMTGGAAPIARGPAQQAVLHALAEGPLSGPAISAAISPVVRNPKWTHCIIKKLARRGAIEQVGKRGSTKFWSLPQSQYPSSAEL